MRYSAYTPPRSVCSVETLAKTFPLIEKTKERRRLSAEGEAKGKSGESSLDTEKGARAIERDGLSTSTSDLEMRGEAKGRDEDSPRMGGEDKETGGEAKKSDEVLPRIVTSTQTKLKMELAKGMGDERFFDIYCRVLESNWSRLFSSPSTTDATSLSPMHFTHRTTGCTRYDAFLGSTLQMYSIQVTEIKDALGLQWPLNVYGMVAARDTLDGNRNIIFLRQRDNCQVLTQEDSCLCLTGPSRAIVATDHVDFDIELKVSGGTESEDKVLMSQTFKYRSIYCSPPTTLYGEFCQIALQFEELENTVQATIVGVRVTKPRRTWPFKHGGRVTCVAKGISKPGELHGRVTKPDALKDKTKLSKEVILQDQVMANHSDGYVDLSRQVVSVELGGKLEVIINEWSESHAFSKHKVHVFFEAQDSKISRRTCYLGHSEVEVTVAWSLLLQDKLAISREGCVEGNQGPSISSSELKIKKAKEMGGEGNERDEVSTKFSTSELEIEKAKEMGGETNGRDEVLPRIPISELEIEEAKVMGGESNGRDEVSPRISTYELEIEKAKVMGDEANGRNEVSPRISTYELEIEKAKVMGVEANGRNEVSPRISTPELEIEKAKEMGGETNGRDEVLPMISTSELEIEKSKEMGGEAKGTVQAEIYSFLDLISKNVMKLKAKSRLRIYSYSRNEIKIHMDNMHSEVTNLLLMMGVLGKEPATEKMGVKGVQIRTDDKGESALETQVPRNFDFLLKSILKSLKQIYALVKDDLDSKSIYEPVQETRDSLTKMKVETEIKAKEMDEAPQKFSLDAVSGENGMDKVSRGISTHGLEEDKETSMEAKRMDEVSPETKLEKAKGGLEEAKMHTILTEEKSFDRYRRGWVSNWSSLYGNFTDTTTLSPMHFTHCTPGHSQLAAFVASTLQMYSIKVTERKEALGLKWPLRVYGVVAARDTVDRNRNILFFRRRDDCQELHKEDPFLRLTGPSRAIVTEEPVHVEIELKVKGTTKSEDRVLMTRVWRYSDRLCTLHTPLAGKFCTLVLSSEELKESVQATIVGVQITKRKPGLFKHGGRVVCSSPPRKGILPDSKHITASSFRQVVLEDGAIDVCSNGYIALSRNVVSVELCGRLEILIYEYSQSRVTAVHGGVSIKAQNCNVTQHKCCLGDSELEISVAWSHLVQDKGFISMEGSDEL